MTSNIVPACLPTTNSQQYTGWQAVVSGSIAIIIIVIIITIIIIIFIMADLDPDLNPDHNISQVGERPGLEEQPAMFSKKPVENIITTIIIIIKLDQISKSNHHCHHNQISKSNQIARASTQCSMCAIVTLCLVNI